MTRTLWTPRTSNDPKDDKIRKGLKSIWRTNGWKPQRWWQVQSNKSESSATPKRAHNKRPLGACIRVTPLTAGDQWRPEDNRMTPSKCWEGIKICQLRFLYLAKTPSAYESELKMLSGQQNVRGCQQQAPRRDSRLKSGTADRVRPEKKPEGHVRQRLGRELRLHNLKRPVIGFQKRTAANYVWIINRETN